MLSSGPELAPAEIHVEPCDERSDDQEIREAIAGEVPAREPRRIGLEDPDGLEELRQGSAVPMTSRQGTGG